MDPETKIPKPDYRTPLAKARDEYLSSEAGQRACDPTTLKAPEDQRQYLTNRIESAFLAGARSRVAYYDKVT